MAVVSRVTTVRAQNITLPATNYRQWIATAAVQDTAAGSSVVVTIDHTEVGTALTLAPDTAEIRFYDGSVNVLTATFSLTIGTSTQTFFFTNNGLTGGSARCGQIEMILRMQKTTGGPTATYHIESDGSPATYPTGAEEGILNRGWIRGTTTLTESVSNISLGGGKTSPAQYDESLFFRATSGAASFTARALTVASSSGSLSSATNSTTSATRDVTFANVCDNRFPAAATTVNWTATIPNGFIATGDTDWTHTTTTDDSISVDPRLTAEHLMQIDNDAFATPPLSLNDPDSTRVFPEGGYLATHFRAARGTRVGTALTEGVNGLTYDVTLDPVNPGSTITFAGRTTATRGGQAGWGSASGVLAAWTQTAPSGVWNKATTITLPADITGAAYLLNSTVAYTFSVANSNIQASFYFNQAANPDSHLIAGDTVILTCALTDLTTRKRVIPTAVSFWATRRGSAGTLQYLNSLTDNTDAAWVNWGQTDAFTEHTLTATADPTFYTLTITNTGGWTKDVLGRIKFSYDGAIYHALMSREIVGAFSPHDSAPATPAAVFDGVDFATGFSFR